jgi:hypothetical protein
MKGISMLTAIRGIICLSVMGLAPLAANACDYDDPCCEPVRCCYRPPVRCCYTPPVRYCRPRVCEPVCVRRVYCEPVYVRRVCCEPVYVRRVYCEPVCAPRPYCYVVHRPCDYDYCD